MNNKKRYYSLLVILLILFMFNISFGAKIEKDFEKLIEFTEGGNIYLKNINGDIKVRSWSRTDVEVKALIQVKGIDDEDAEDFLNDVDIQINKTSNNINIEVDYPNKTGGMSFWDILFGWGRPGVSITFRLMVPEKSELEMITTNGNINIGDI